MANDIEGLTSSETVSQPCRADLPGNEPDRRSEHSGTDPVGTNFGPVVGDMAHVRSENQTSDNGAVPNGCVHHRVVDDCIYWPGSTRDEKCCFSSTDPNVYSGGSDGSSFSHGIVKLAESADAESQSKAAPAKECMTSGDIMQRELTKEFSGDGEGNDDTETVTELLASTKISNDLPEVPLDALSDGSSHAVGDESCDAVRSSNECRNGVEYVMYESEKQMPDIMSLITKDLSEPYSIYTYRYFIHNWPNLCFLALHQSKCVGAIVCKLDTHKKVIKRGYIAMLAVAQDYRKRGIGSHLVIRAIKGMVADGCDEVVLETEITNKAALHLYENLGFVRDKRLFRYYLNGVDALRLKLWLK